MNNAKKEKNELSNELKETVKREKIIRKNIDLSFLPENTNILIFNASKLSNAHIIFENMIRKNSSLSNISSTWEWMQRYEMEVTRIYYLNDKAKLLANSLNSVLLGRKQVIDYREQSIMGGIREDRDLVIFVGNDLVTTLIPKNLP